MKTFYHLLGNTLLATFTNFTVWFAITFFAFLETNSVLVTGLLAGIYLAAVALSGFWLGSIVDHHRKKYVMLGSSILSLVAYVIGFVLYITAAPDAYQSAGSPALWILIVLLLAGVLAGNLRNIALPTLVTLLIPEDRRDKANGLVGTVSGVSFLLVSVVSGLLVGHSGMYLVLILAIGITLAAIAHLLTIRIDEPRIAHGAEQPRIDLRGTLRVIRRIPGLPALIVFSTINNLLGGVFMALMDAYGLSFVSVETWGLLWGGLSVGLIAGGMLVARFGLGDRPLRALFIANIISWTSSMLFTTQQSLILLVGGMLVWFLVMPFAEAAEQTVLQKVVPHERQGRVFGFAQSVEQAASPLSAFLIGPLTQFFFIPFMTDGMGARLIGSWFGTGPSRGIALVFTIAGIIGLILTIFAMMSRYYRQLSASYAKEQPA